MKDLGANTIRVYHVEDSADHKGCMSAFEEQGIYVFLDLDTFTTQINPGTATWNQTQYDRFSAVLDEFQVSCIYLETENFVTNVSSNTTTLPVYSLATRSSRLLPTLLLLRT